jgi:hypothetical protein
MFTDSLLHPIDLCDAGSNNCAVINMYKNDCNIRSGYFEKNTLVHVTAQKSKVINQDFTQTLVPSTSGLLESIQHLPQMADAEGMSGINKTGRLMHVNDFIICQLPVKVSPFYVNLVDFQISSGSNGEDGANGG